ncbi:MAG: hypothetical protein ACLQFR_06700 [Streptosporangiaceae bacterium]
MLINGRRAAGAGIAAAVLVTTGGSGLSAASNVPGWRIVSTDQRTGIDDELAVVALSRTNAWAGGNVAPSHTQPPGVPFVEHWNGHRWRNYRLPAGMSGSIEVLSASSWNNVWAIGAPYTGSGGAFALRFNGSKWRVMKRWPALSTLAGAVVNSPTDVWLFSGVSGAVEHYDGTRWRAATIAPGVNWFDSARALPGGQIWALANAGGGMEAVTGTPDAGGYTWAATQLTGYSSGSAGSDALTTIVPVSASNVWALGGGLRIVKGRNHWYPLVAHWTGHGWHRVQVTGSFTLQLDAAASDGHGGLWVTTGWDSTGIPPHLLHFVNGKFVKVSVPPRGGRYVGVFGLARIPGSISVWGVGALTGLGAGGPNAGIILKYGH